MRLIHREDIAQVTEIDREAFPTMLPPTNYQRELKSPLVHYIVAYDDQKMVDGALVEAASRRPVPRNKVAPPGRQYIVTFAGLWIMAGEAHIINIAVRQSYRRKGIGELLLISLIDLAIKLNSLLITLEVRASNTAALSLYRKYGFVETRLRRGYYSDNREDAVVMTVEDIGSAAFQENLNRLKQAHSRKWSIALYQIAP